MALFKGTTYIPVLISPKLSSSLVLSVASICDTKVSRDNAGLTAEQEFNGHYII